MKGMRNHEWYHDPTAGVAIRRCGFERRREKSRRLTYKVGESPRFPHVAAGSRDTQMILKIRANGEK